MSKEILVVAEHLNGKLADITFEILGKGRELAEQAQARLVSLLIGNAVKPLADQMGLADTVLSVEDERLAAFNPEAFRLVVAEVIEERRPWLILIGSTSMGLDLAASLSAKLDIPLVNSCRDLRFDEGRLIPTSQLYGGKVLIDVEITHDQAICTILPGAFQAETGRAGTGSPVLEQVLIKTALDGLRVQFERLIEPDASDVDITQAPVLVSVGRGIQTKENLPLVENLAEALGGAVSASRPVVDQGWLPMTRQVGRSGMIVKPKLYLAVGISGAPEHVEGMKDAELIIAVNSDPNAPIFNVASYGVVGDALELVPALTEEIRRRKAAAWSGMENVLVIQ